MWFKNRRALYTYSINAHNLCQTSIAYVCSLYTERMNFDPLYVCIEKSSATEENSIRLSDGVSLNEGRVDILLHKQWGTVCDSNWDLLDAIVACRQLGYQTAKSALRGSPFGEGSGPNWMRNVQCTGHESNLTQCRHQLGHDSCRHHAGVICSSE